MLNLKVIVGSTREGRFSEKLLPWITDTFTQYPDLAVEVLDLRDYDLPFFASPQSPAAVKDGQYGHEAIDAWASKIAEADGFLIITPEYNHSFSAVLKNAFDVIYHEWTHKAVGFVAYGSLGGARAVGQLRQIMPQMQIASARSAVHISGPWNLQDDAGNLKDGALDTYTDGLKATIDDLIWWSEALKTAREK